MGQPCHLLSLLAFWESQSRQQAAGPGGAAEPRVSGDAQREEADQSHTCQLRLGQSGNLFIRSPDVGEWFLQHLF